jgi:hypothetical protein
MRAQHVDRGADVGCDRCVAILARNASGTPDGTIDGGAALLRESLPAVIGVGHDEAYLRPSGLQADGMSTFLRRGTAIPRDPHRERLG